MDRDSLSHGIEIIGAAARSRLDDRVLDLLAEHIDQNGIPRFLYLSPTRRKNREMEMRLQQRRLSWKPRFLVPMGLAQKMLEDLPDREFRWVGSELKILLIWKILERAEEGAGLSTLRFRESSTPMGVARHVAHAMDVLARRGLTPVDGAAGLPSSTAGDLDRVCSEYRDALKDHGLTDPVEIPELAANALREKECSLPEPTDLLVLDGFVAPDHGETEFILELSASFRGKRVVVTLPTQVPDLQGAEDPDRLPDRLRMFRHGKRLFQGLGAWGWSVPRPLDGSSSRVPPAREDLSLRSYPDRAAEVKGIARAVKKLFFATDAPESLAPDDFHIVVPNIDPYYRLFIEIFPRYGIPFNITRGIPPASIPVVGLIQTLMDSILERDRLTLFRLFSSALIAPPAERSTEGFSGFLDRFSQHFESVMDPNEALELTHDQEPLLDFALIDRACRVSGVRGGRDIQSDWVAPLARSYSGRIISARSSGGRLNEKRTRRELAALLRQLWLLDAEFSAFDLVETEAQGRGDLIGSLNGLIRRYRLNENLIQSLAAIESEIPVGRQIVLEKNVKGFNRAIEVLAEIERDLTVAGDLNPTIGTVRQIFRDRCKREMIQEAGELKGVSISQLLEIRNLVRPVVFMAGLTSHEFPLLPVSGFLLPGGPESPDVRKATDESHYLLHHAIENSNRLELSYPTSDGTDPLEPSPIIEDLRQQGLLGEEAEIEETWAPCAAYEILEETGRSWAEGMPVPWDRVKQLLACYPLKSGDAIEGFHEEVRRVFTACLLRSSHEEQGPYDGMIGEPEISALVNRILDHSRFSYSAAMLNDYRVCPMSFFFKRVLSLAPVPEIPEEPEAADVGTVVHEILARFYAARRDSGLGRIHPGNRVEALAGLFRTANEIFNEHDSLSGDRIEAWGVRQRVTRGLLTPEHMTDPVHLQKARIGTDIALNRRGLLRILVDYESQADLPLHPWSMEFPFGYEDNPPLVIDGMDGRRIRVRGKIDRVDLYGKSPTEPTAAAWIFDYKTGRCPSLMEVKAGNDLQLPVYMLAVLEVFTEHPIEEVGACFLSLNIREDAPRKALIHTTGIPDELIARSRRSSWEVSHKDLESFRSAIRDIDESIRRGYFPRSETPSRCGFCDYSWACFRDEHRIQAVSGP